MCRVFAMQIKPPGGKDKKPNEFLLWLIQDIKITEIRQQILEKTMENEWWTGVDILRRMILYIKNMRFLSTPTELQI